MEKGKLGIRLSFYAVAAFILAFLGYSTVLALLVGFVLIVEKNEWASRQVIQAFFLCIFANIVDGILGIFDFLYQIPLMGSVWGTAISVIDGIVSLVVLIFLYHGSCKHSQRKRSKRSWIKRTCKLGLRHCSSKGKSGTAGLLWTAAV